MSIHLFCVVGISPVGKWVIRGRGNSWRSKSTIELWGCRLDSAAKDDVGPTPEQTSLPLKHFEDENEGEDEKRSRALLQSAQQNRRVMVEEEKAFASAGRPWPLTSTEQARRPTASVDQRKISGVHADTGSQRFMFLLTMANKRSR